MGGLGETLAGFAHHRMYPYFDVDGLSVAKLLSEWRWLCPDDFRLVAANAFGDLFLEDKFGAIYRLDTTSGYLNRIAETLRQFNDETETASRRQEWFAEDVAAALGEQGFAPSKGYCIGYKTPIVFAESTGTAENVYIAELYEYVSFLGNLHLQMRDVPDGGKVRLTVGKKPDSNQDGSKV